MQFRNGTGVIPYNIWFMVFYITIYVISVIHFRTPAYFRFIR